MNKNIKGLAIKSYCEVYGLNEHEFSFNQDKFVNLFTERLILDIIGMLEPKENIDHYPLEMKLQTIKEDTVKAHIICDIIEKYVA